VCTVMIIIVWIMSFVVKLYLESQTDRGYTIAENFPLGAQSGSLWPLVGVLLFNWGLAKFLPSWINEKKREVPVYGTINRSYGLTLCVYVLIGFLGAFAFGKEFLHGTRSDILQAITQAHILPRPMLFMGRIAAFAFPLIGCLPGIPVFAIVIRYNLMEMGAPTPLATFMGVLFPWVFSIPFLVWSEAFIDIMSLGALCVVSVVDFLLPMYVWLRLQDWLLIEVTQCTESSEILGTSSPEKHNLQQQSHNDMARWMTPGRAKVIMGVTGVVVLACIVGTILF